jgi:hypothetical protein
MTKLQQMPHGAACYFHAKTSKRRAIAESQ